MITEMIDPFVALHQNYNPYRRFWKTIQFRNVAETRGRDKHENNDRLHDLSFPKKKD
jgi:hypothetical protein